MDPRAEAVVRRPLRGDVERRVGHRERVGAGAVREHLDDASPRDVEALEVHVLQGLAGHPGDGRVDPHDLLDGLGAELGALAEQSPLVRVREQGLQGEPDLVARRLHPGEGQEDQRHRQLALAQSLGLHKCADQVVPRPHATVGHDLVEVRRQAGQRRLDARHLGGDVDRERCPEVVGPVRHLSPVALVEAEQQADDAGGVGLGELTYQLDPAPRRELVDQLVGERLEGRGHRGDGAVAEGRHHQPADAGVVVALEAEQGLAPPPGERTVVDAVLLRPAGVALPEAAIAQQGRHLVVAQHRPTPVGPDVPALVAGLQDHRRGDVEGRVGQVEGRHERTMRRCLPSRSTVTMPSSRNE
ncbi:unannotated protein [freshwater metagenome]|uniref:Unannotated protein n=1 Tax=freshwater metagenome TaxID=449393 RepID=A0A6J6P429_9ZZZZ